MMTSVTASLEEEETSYKILSFVSIDLQYKLNILSICGACQMTIDFLWEEEKNPEKDYDWRREKRPTFCSLLFCATNWAWIYSLASVYSSLPWYSGKHFLNSIERNVASVESRRIETYLKLDRVIFSANKSFLFKKRIMDVLTNHLLLQIESNNRRDSCIRLVVSSSTRTLTDERWVSKENECFSRVILLDRIHLMQRWKLLLWHLRNNESISFSPIVVLRHRTRENSNLWRWN